ncbi:MAG: radical SAM/SPASM domain-containing protein [Spirochaetes bacterium]|nr:radical SAM/SPASM domain-containing protein [Spirochaetota bacterium]
MKPDNLFDIRISDFFETVKRGTAGKIRPLRLVEAALFQRRQTKRRATAADRGLTVPPILITSLTRRCNLDCEGCYSRAPRPPLLEGTTQGRPDDAELSDDRFMELFEEAVDLGVGVVLLAGGEPLLRRSLVERASRLKGILLPLFTNGTLIDEELLQTAALGSIVPVLSIEGEESHTDGRRGLGVHAGALRWMEEMRRRRVIFGASVTLTSENAGTVLDPAFLAGLAVAGASVLFVIEYVPVTRGTEGLVVEAGQRASVNAPERFADLPFPVVVLPGDEEDYGGCLAAGRGFVHLSSEGRMEACPFAPFSDSSSAVESLASALASPMLAAIREHHGELTETSGGCALWNKGGWIASLGACSGAEPSARDQRTERI